MDYDLIRKNFEKHGFTTAFFSTGEEVVAYLAGKYSQRSIGFGGSLTLRQLGLYEALSKNNSVIWHHLVPGSETRHLCAHSKIYMTSANAVSMTGEIINIDGEGNRVSMTLYGPDQVHFLIGRNKIAPDRDSAIYRARNTAAPKNAQRQNFKLPCAVTGDKCFDCNSPQRMCNATVIMDRAMRNLPMEVIFIDQDLGL